MVLLGSALIGLAVGVIRDKSRSWWPGVVGAVLLIIGIQIVAGVF